MGASTKWYVQVFRIVEDVIEVNAIDSEDAREEADNERDVAFTGWVKHWSEVENDL